MKRIILLMMLMLLSIGFMYTIDNPTVTRISSGEIKECKTPSSVAYNFIIACLNKDKNRILSLSTSDFREMISADYNDFISSFSNPENTKLYIDSWLPIPEGCEIAVLYDQIDEYKIETPEIEIVEEPFIEESVEELESEEYVIEEAVEENDIAGEIDVAEPASTLVTYHKVYVNVVPSSEIDNVGFQDITRRFGTNVKVVVENIDGKWLVRGFK